jgi:hypothetical protein
MRTSLFLSALFAVSLVGGIASAEKPDVREARKRTDMVDRTYTKSDLSKDRISSARATLRSNPPARINNPGENRWNCSGVTDDCRAREQSRVTRVQAAEKNSTKMVKQPKHHKADNRWNCPIDGECAGVKSPHGGSRATANRNSGQNKAAPAQSARDDARASVAADRGKSDKDVVKPMTYKEKREAERMKNMLKHAVCKKTGADC